jgi:hypothetical protein
MCKLFALFNSQNFTFKYILKEFLKNSKKLEACCFKALAANFVQQFSKSERARDMIGFDLTWCRE